MPYQAIRWYVRRQESLPWTQVDLHCWSPTPSPAWMARALNRPVRHYCQRARFGGHRRPPLPLPEGEGRSWSSSRLALYSKTHCYFASPSLQSRQSRARAASFEVRAQRQAERRLQWVNFLAQPKAIRVGFRHPAYRGTRSRGLDRERKSEIPAVTLTPRASGVAAGAN